MQQEKDLKIGHFIRLKRQQANLTQEQCATALGFEHRSTYNRLESGKLKWKLESFVKMAELLGREPGELLTEGSEAMKRES
jgi:transcriptional regulator with XRE-family HTH domain